MHLGSYFGLVLIVLINRITIIGSSYLWFPRYTVLQVTMAMVLPFEHPVHKLNLNVGIQCNYNLPWNATEFTHPTYWSQRDLHGAVAKNDTRFRRDLSAGEFYSGLEDLFEERGFHSTCILKTVCEMAQHTFHEDDDNVLTAILHFIFTPSLHDAFEDHESEFRDQYLRAERLGRQGRCEEYFRKCPKSPIDEFSYLDHEE